MEHDDFQPSRALLAGAFAASVMSAVMMIARMLGMPVKLELIIGSLFTGTTGPGAWLFGYLLHIGFGALFAFAYAAMFHYAGKATVGRGAVYGMIHALTTGALLAFIPAIHPLVPQALAAPGPYLAHLGVIGMVAFLALHVLYGAIVARLYAPVDVPQVVVHTPR